MPAIAKQIKGAEVLYSIFFNDDGPACQIPVPNGFTINGKHGCSASPSTRSSAIFQCLKYTKCAKNS